MIILGIDPGGTTGYGQIKLDTETKKLTLMTFGETKDPEAIELFDLIKESDYVCIEDWKTRPKHLQRNAFDWNPMIAARVIGALRMQFRLSQKPDDHLVMQQPSQKVPGLAWLGMKYQKGKKGMHSQDALAHAVFFAVSKFGALPLKRAST